MIILTFLALAQADSLADLTRRSAELHSFTATYELTSSAAPGTAQIRMEYVAPARVRVDRSMGEQHASMWCVDGVVAMTNFEGGSTLQGRADSSVVYGELDPIEKALHAGFPKARARTPHAAAVGMHWDFDTNAKRANFSIEADLVDEVSTPLGWLQTLREKGVVPREEGNLLHFETDTAFQIAISKTSGFVEQFSGVSPQGELHLRLVLLVPNQAIDPARFEFSAQVPGARDVSPDLLRAVRRVADVGLRERIYAAIAGPDSPATWDAALEARISAVLLPFHELNLPQILGSSMERWDKIRETIARNVAEMRKAGKPEEEVEALRQRESGYMNKQLDELEQGFLTRLQVPPAAASLPRAKDLLAVETRVLSDAFRSKVREPTVSAFEKATKK